MQFLWNSWLLSGIVQCLESRNLSKKINSVGTGCGPELWGQDSETPEHSILPQNSFQLWFWNQKVEGKKRYFGGQKGSLWCFPFDGLPALWYTSWERLQGYREHKLKESTGISWILHKSRSFDTWLPCTRPSILCAAPCRVEYAICMIIVIIITSSWTTFSALWSRRRRGIRGAGIQAAKGMERGEEKVWGISFNPFASGFQFLTMECIPGLYSDGFSDKLAKEFASRKNVNGASMDTL